MEKNNGDDEFSQQKKMIQLEERLLAKQRTIDAIAKKSFILRNSTENIDTNQEELQIIMRLNKQFIDSNYCQFRLKQKEDDSYQLAHTTPMSSQYWKIIFKRNASLIGWVLLDFSANLLLYPLDTIKTRTQARNKIADYSHFTKNNVNSMGLYPGLYHRLFQILITDLFRSFSNKIRLAYEEQNPESYLVIFISIISEEQKQFNQIVNNSIPIGGINNNIILTNRIKEIGCVDGKQKNRNSKIKQSLHFSRRILFPAIMRDSLFFFSHSLLYNSLLYKSFYLKSLYSNEPFIAPATESFYTNDKRIGYLICSILLSLAITHPFDVVFTKLATQKEKIYTGPFHCANFVKIEEGWAKLMFSAFSNRAAFYLLKGTIFFTYSDSVLRLSQQALED